jgi:hypothetical protein
MWSGLSQRGKERRRSSATGGNSAVVGAYIRKSDLAMRSYLWTAVMGIRDLGLPRNQRRQE